MLKKQLSGQARKLGLAIYIVGHFQKRMIQTLIDQYGMQMCGWHLNLCNYFNGIVHIKINHLIFGNN